MMMLQGGDGTAEDDEAFWAKLEADSGRATGGSSAPVSSASSEVRSTVFLENYRRTVWLPRHAHARCSACH